jgi:hypothetical protein
MALRRLGIPSCAMRTCGAADSGCAGRARLALQVFTEVDRRSQREWFCDTPCRTRRPSRWWICGTPIKLTWVASVSYVSSGRTPGRTDAVCTKVDRGVRSVGRSDRCKRGRCSAIIDLAEVNRLEAIGLPTGQLNLGRVAAESASTGYSCSGVFPS